MTRIKKWAWRSQKRLPRRANAKTSELLAKTMGEGLSQTRISPRNPELVSGSRDEILIAIRIAYRASEFRSRKISMNKMVQKISILLLLFAFVFPSFNFDSFRLGSLFAPKPQKQVQSTVSASANAANDNPAEVQTGQASAEISVVTVVNLDIEDEQTIVVQAEPGETKSESSIVEKEPDPVFNPIRERIMRMLRNR